VTVGYVTLALLKSPGHSMDTAKQHNRPYAPFADHFTVRNVC